jgi:CubicO group peptidase (beta-lactamase class C family)
MSSFDTARLTRIKGWMQGHVDAQHFAGCSALIWQGGAEAFYHDCGQRDVAAGKPWQRDTVARIYSMTKPITSVALMILVERGLVHLDAPVSDFITGFADASLRAQRTCRKPRLAAPRRCTNCSLTHLALAIRSTPVCCRWR